MLVTTDSGGIEYTFSATERITPLYNRPSYRANRSEPTDYAEENDDGTWTAYGQTGGGSGESGDSFRFEGELIDFSATGDVDALTLYADGEELTTEELLEQYGESADDDDGSDESTDDSGEESEEPDEGSDEESGDETEDSAPLSNRVIIDGTRVDSVASYAFHVSGDVEVDDAISSEGESRWDAMDDVVEDGSVTGVVGKGIDGFRYSGEITSISVDGVVDVSIESTDL